MVRRSLRAGLGITMVLCTVLAAFAFMLETKMIGRPTRHAPPAVDASRAETLARPLAAETYAGAVPAVNFHDISDRGGPYTTTAATFALQLAALRAAGYRSVSLEQVDALVSGRPVALPRRPILITFDDGARSAWTTADPILERYGFRAAMFVITDRVAAKDNSYYLTWDQLRAMRHSGRWEIGAHTADQHHPIPVPDGGEAPALTNRGVLPGGHVETLEQWRNRIEQDFDRADQALRQHLSVHPIAFAYPFAADDTPTDDPRIPANLRFIVAGHYRMAFGDGTSGHAVVTPLADRWVLPRVRVGGSVTAPALLARLAADVPVGFARVRGLGWAAAGGQCAVDSDGVEVVAGGYATCRPIGNTDIWRDYRLATGIDGVTPTATASVTVRDGEPGRVAVLVGASVTRIRQQVGRGPWQELAALPLRAPGRTRSLVIELAGDRATVTVDGVALVVSLDPAIAAGGITLGAALRGPATIHYGQLDLSGPTPPTAAGA